MNLALETILLEAVNSAYILYLHNVFTIYMGLSTKDIMNYLMERYGNIAAAGI